MTTVEVDLLTDQGNGAVVRLPARQSPGVLVQGDTLSVWLGSITEASEALARNDRRETEMIILHLASEIKALKDRYEDALKKHGIQLPYSTS